MPCWVCDNDDLVLVKEGNVPSALDSEAFRITDAAYGTTATIYRCPACGFLQCQDLDDVLSFYEEMEDQTYEETRAPRALQARKLIDQIKRWRRSGRLLDVGAGSGILVEEAERAGFAAEGIEPSGWLQRQAVDRGLKVHHGVLPHPEAGGPFDLVTLIDVVEHVPTPVPLLAGLRDVMADDGLAVVVTPDVGSMAARLMGWKWWHYRIAHIGYFNRKTLDRAIRAAGLAPVQVHRPWWYHPGDYLAERAFGYLPRAIRPPVPGFLRRLTVPLNLFDSLMVVCRRA